MVRGGIWRATFVRPRIVIARPGASYLVTTHQTLMPRMEACWRRPIPKLPSGMLKSSKTRLKDKTARRSCLRSTGFGSFAAGAIGSQQTAF